MTPIEQIIFSERGNLDKTPLSKEYKKLIDVYIAHDNKMRQLLAPTPDLLAQYIETTEAGAHAQAEEAKDYLAEGLRFGILLGIDIAKSPEE